MAPSDPQGLAPPTHRQQRAGPGWPTRLSADIWLYRHGWALPAAVVMLLLAGLVQVTQIGPMLAERGPLQSRLQAALARASAPPAAPPPAPAEPGQRLRDTLAQAEDSPAQVRRIAAIARLHGIRLPRGQYSYSSQSPSGITHTDITFSFVAGYPQSRAFIEGLLRELPNASVDRVSFERDQAQGREAEITLRLTLWRWPATSNPEAGR